MNTPSPKTSKPWLRVATVHELDERGVVVVSSGIRRIAVFSQDGEIFAVDNRCPHMGFPLERGTVADGILTCHWHQARFDLASGCTFDLFADDVPRFDTNVADDVVYVAPEPRQAQDEAYYRRRLQRAVEQNIPLVQAKSLLGLLDLEADLRGLLRDVALYASRNLPSFGEGLVRLACVANLHPDLSRETAYQALLYAVRRLSSETQSSVPRRERDPLGADDHRHEVLKRWLRQWVLTRHRDAAERTILTAIRAEAPREAVADLVYGAASERLFANGGHLFDFGNKIFELVDHLGWETAEDIFPLIVVQLTGARGEEESTNWHHPIEIAEPLREAEARIPELLRRGAGGRARGGASSGRGSTRRGSFAQGVWGGGAELVEMLLGDDPIAIIGALEAALAAGVRPEELARRVAYAAALRLARFATSNEVTDWFNPQHTFSYTNAVHAAIERSEAPDVVRAIFHGAIAVYQDRYLNVPPARLPGEGAGQDELPRGEEDLRRRLLETLDQRSEIDAAAALVSRWVRLGHPLAGLIDTLVLACVREDIDFHSLQVIDAGARQCRAWGDGPEVEHILVGVVRNLAAHCPTRRAGQQTANIALRLHRGDHVFEEAEAAADAAP